MAASLWQVLRAAAADWQRHRATSKAAALAYYTMFSIAPVLVLVIAIAGMFYGAEAARGQLMTELQGLLGRQGGAAITLVLAGAHNHGSGLLASVVAGVLLLVGATTAFAELKESLDDLWEVAPNTDGWFDTVRTRLLSFGVVLALAFLLLVSLVISALLALLEHALGGYWNSATMLLSWLAAGTAYLVIALLFGVIFKLLPQVRLAWRDVTIGALGTAALFAVGKQLIGLYIGNSGLASSFGAAGSMIALLLWVYYSALILFFGAAFTRQYALQLGSLRARTGPTR